MQLQKINITLVTLIVVYIRLVFWNVQVYTSIAVYTTIRVTRVDNICIMLHLAFRFSFDQIDFLNSH